MSGQEENLQATHVASEAQGNVWVVDYDLSASDQHRYRFYRALNKLKKELGLHGKMSTQSVLITADKEFAWRVYELARRYTSRAHIYGPLRER